MNQAQAQIFINSNGYSKLWGYEAEKEKWTFSIRPWISIRLDRDSVNPVDAALVADWPPLHDAAGNPAQLEEAEFTLFEWENAVLTKRLLRLPGIVIFPPPAPGGREIPVEDYRFARCLERPDAAGENLLDRTLRHLDLAVAG